MITGKWRIKLSKPKLVAMKLGSVASTFPQSVGFALKGVPEKEGAVIDTARNVNEMHPRAVGFTFEYGLRQITKDRMAPIAPEFKVGDVDSWCAMHSGIKKAKGKADTVTVTATACEKIAKAPGYKGGLKAFRAAHATAHEVLLRAAADRLWGQMIDGSVADYVRQGIPAVNVEAMRIAKALGESQGWSKKAGPAIPSTQEALEGWLTACEISTAKHAKADALAEAIYSKAAKEVERRANAASDL